MFKMTENKHRRSNIKCYEQVKFLIIEKLYVPGFELKLSSLAGKIKALLFYHRGSLSKFYISK